MALDPGQDVSEIDLRIVAMEFSSLDDGQDTGDALTALVRPGEEPIFPSGSKPSSGHSAHIGEEVEIHYRWHAFYGRQVRLYYGEQRRGCAVVVVEHEPGVTTAVERWMLDRATCAAMKLEGSIYVISEGGIVIFATGQAWDALSRRDDFHVACLRALPAAYAASARRFRNISRFML